MFQDVHLAGGEALGGPGERVKSGARLPRQPAGREGRDHPDGVGSGVAWVAAYSTPPETAGAASMPPSPTSEARRGRQVFLPHPPAAGGRERGQVAIETGDVGDPPATTGPPSLVVLST
jgi:hypothetical protein